MKAVVIAIESGGAGPTTRKTNLTLASRPDPILRENELLVQVAASPIQPSDWLNSQGNFPHTTFPRVPGRDFAGVVVKPDSSPWHGKAVYGTSGPELGFSCDGAHAELVVVHEDAVAEVPQGMDLKQASVMPVPWTTACIVLTRAGAKQGESVLVLGAGGAVGGAVVQLAKSSLFRCRVLTGGRGSKYDVDTSNDLKAAKELTQGNGPDVIIDTTGDLGLLDAALAQLNKGGRLAVITTGSSSGRSTTTVNVDFKRLYRLEHSIIGCNSVEHSAQEMAEWLRKMKTPLESGELKAPDVSKYTEVKLGDAISAYTEMGNGSRKKFVIVNDL